MIYATLFELEKSFSLAYWPFHTKTSISHEYIDYFYECHQFHPHFRFVPEPNQKRNTSVIPVFICSTGVMGYIMCLGFWGWCSGYWGFGAGVQLFGNYVFHFYSGEEIRLRDPRDLRGLGHFVSGQNKNGDKTIGICPKTPTPKPGDERRLGQTYSFLFLKCSKLWKILWTNRK